MNKNQHTCIVIDKNEQLRKELVELMSEQGLDVFECKQLDMFLPSDLEPDVIVFGQNVDVADADTSFSDFELLIRECQIPIVASLVLRDSLLNRFQEVHVYPDLDVLGIMARTLAFNQVKRRLIKEDMCRAVQGIFHLDEADFYLKTVEEAQAIALLISLLAPAKKLLRLGLTELLINAVEHGNLEIGAQEKQRLRESGTWMSEVNRRLNSDRYRDKKVHLHLSKTKQELLLRIEDEGQGFDWQKILQDNQNVKVQAKSGRGLRLAQRSGFDEFSYIGKGNIVECRFAISDLGAANG
ncbi:MAG: ATP-binding protein [Methylocystaceae bacterium]|nr:ATP-binding protein [Methylocystaceae bacterium]